MAFNKSETEKPLDPMQELLEFKAAGKAILKEWTPTGLLGSGAFANVFGVKNKSGEKAALKFIPIPKQRGKCEEDPNYYRLEFEDRQKEAKLLAQFKGSPHIIQIIGDPEFLTIHIVDKNSHKKLTRHAILILMPLLKSMHEWRPEIKNSVPDRLKLGEQIATALVAFNEKKIRHRDIKPGNILMDDAGNFLLTDLGEAKEGDKTTTHTPRGTEGYMAPEVYHSMMKEEAFDHRADIYSFGIVLYELFNWGQKPFIGKNGELDKKSIYEYQALHGEDIPKDYRLSSWAFTLRYSGEIELPAPGELVNDKELARIILKACSYEPDKRYSNAQALLQDIQSYQKKHPKPPPPPPDSEPPIPFPHDRIRPEIVAAAALAMVIAAGIGYWFILPFASVEDGKKEPRAVSTQAPASIATLAPTVSLTQAATPTPSATFISTPTPALTSTPTLVLTSAPSSQSTFTPAPIPTATPAPVQINQYARVPKGKMAIIRTSADSDANVQRTLTSEEVMFVYQKEMGRDGSYWYIVSFGDEEKGGYVLANQVSMMDDSETKAYIASLISHTPKAANTLTPTLMFTPEPTPTLTAMPTATPRPAIGNTYYIEGMGYGATGNEISAKLTIKDGQIVSCNVNDPDATDKMQAGYELVCRAMEGKSVEDVAAASARELLQEAKAYGNTVGMGLSNGGDDRLSAQNLITAIKDAVK